MPSEVRLTRAQKWDLLRMSGAAVVSTVFFAVPMFLARPNVARPEARPALQVASMMPDAVAAGNPDSFLPANAPNTVSVVTSTEVAAVTTPVLQPPAAAPRQRASGGTVEARASGNAPAATPFGRRLARLIAGKGRYGVRPFPSVSTSGS
jgi:hypothetical protein